MPHYTGETTARRCDEEQLYKVKLCRNYRVETAESSHQAWDCSHIWFAEEKERSAFVMAFRSWECLNPQVQPAGMQEAEQ
mmetsp:Transcript_64842/g.150793  ORF Transcript_64842/g.150793 Transcript_64842/m.150793 type:complete len:80 (-) Transcript_64842:48-287(-)